MKLRPLGSKIIVKAAEEEEKTAGGVLLPDTAKKKPQEGKVLAVGPGRRMDDGTVHPVAVSVDDTVIFSKYGGTEVTLEGEEFIILDEDQVYAKKE